MRTMIILQFNEASLELIKRYAAVDSLSNLKRLIERENFIETIANEAPQHLEPWIQWVSFYTGKPFEHHQVFHLGDFDTTPPDELFTALVRLRLRVGLFGSMNHPGHPGLTAYLPDPWSTRKPDDSFSSLSAHKVISFLVKRNAQLPNPASVILGILVMWWGAGLIKTTRTLVFAFFARIRKNRAKLATYFDFFFLRYCVARHRKLKLDVSAVFINGLAHVQHHYMLSSSFLKGQNPAWYVGKNQDPVRDALKVYDEIFGWLEHQGIEYSVITALGQQPYPKPEFYWRINQPQQVFSWLFKKPTNCIQLMTRDLKLVLENEFEAQQASELLSNIDVADHSGSHKAFGFIERQNKSVFCSFVYDGDGTQAKLETEERQLDLDGLIDFVAIKNAGHCPHGWASMSKQLELGDDKSLPIEAVGSLLLGHFKKQQAETHNQKDTS